MMKKLISWFAVLITGCLVLQFGLLARASCIARSFEANQVVPDAIPVAPQLLIKITYPSGVQVHEGNELTPTNVKDMPSVEWDTDPNAFYTITLLDLDAPSRENPTIREFNHWLVGNIPGNDIIKGDTVFAFASSAPGLNTGLHRYVFLVYKQPSKLEFTENMGERVMFDVTKFAQKYNLGDPVAGNFYQAQYDDYVPILLNQAGL